MIGFILFLFGWLVLTAICLTLWQLIIGVRELKKRVIELQNQIDDDALNYQVDVMHIERQLSELESITKGKMLRVH